MNTALTTTPTADSQRTLRSSIAHCRRVTRRRARNFYYGLRLTPEPKRSALYVIYAFMRAADDLADSPDTPHPHEPQSPQNTHQRLEQFRSVMQRVTLNHDPPDHPTLHPMLWPALQHVIRTYPIDPALLHAMLDGQQLDLLKHRYRTFQELYDYCYKVASVVGLVCLRVWGFTGGPPTLKLAEHRGIALQLTNILRDLVEDAARGRVYLPQEELARFGYTSDSFSQAVLNRQATPAFVDLMTFQTARARSYYQASSTLEQHIDPSCRPASWAIMRVYDSLLRQIEHDPRIVLRRRVRLHPLKKFSIALQASWSRHLHS